MKKFIALAAASLNGVIGHQGAIPWHLPEDFKWFKATTLGHTIVMGRKTYESIGRPLPGRTTLLMSRSGFVVEGIETVRSVQELLAKEIPGTIFIAGGAEIYAQTLPYCRELFLTLVKRECLGDTFFPDFIDYFKREEVYRETADFTILRYSNVETPQNHPPEIFPHKLKPRWGQGPAMEGASPYAP
jgi:dihydrofolate reductase